MKIIVNNGGDTEHPCPNLLLVSKYSVNLPLPVFIIAVLSLDKFMVISNRMGFNPISDVDYHISDTGTLLYDFQLDL